MALVNAYASTAELAAELGIADEDDDIRIERAIATATKQINEICSRRFWQDSTVVERTYYADDQIVLRVDDVSTLTGLVVKLDTDSDGTFETELTINTDFIMMPLNAELEVPKEPYTEIVMLETYRWPVAQRRPGVSVTAKFGYLEVPTDINQACLVQAKTVYKSTAGTFSGFQLAADAGIVMRTPSVDPVARGLLDSYMLDLVG